ncbi:MAG: hypothetical protein DMG89_01535 [Acidobacteria bacterium]|nr:MAG: hypothetical protein DMG89_01535 [Acidobacteriota bacterium]
MARSGRLQRESRELGMEPIGAPAVTKGPTPPAQTNALQKDYNEDVRYYTTKQINDGITFKCIACEFSVNTLEFDHMKGNRRTQAAAAINEHAKSLHSSQLRIVAPLKRAAGGGF